MGKIQSSVRGHPARKQVASKKQQAKDQKKIAKGEDLTLMEFTPDMEEAAVKIQERGRGFLARKKVGGKKKNEPKINKVTGRVMTPEESEEEKAVVKIQAGVRDG